MPAHRLHVTDEGFPVFAVPPDSKPITREMVERASEEDWAEPAPLPLLRNPVPVEGIDLATRAISGRSSEPGI
jgi:hypothetical protein